jgi:hypothetical protein
VKKILSVSSTWARGFGFALVLAMNGSVFGQGIIYVTPNPQPYYSLGYPGTFDFAIDINGDGTTDFILRSNDGGSGVNNAVLIPQGGNMIAVMSSYVSDMTNGDVVGSSLSPIYQWSNAKTPIGTLAELLDPIIAEDGNFVGQTDGYIGFDLVDSGMNYYGWMYVSSPDEDGLAGDAGTYGIITRWAYESDPNTPITVGTVPEPATWSLLSIAASLALYRRR